MQFVLFCSNAAGLVPCRLQHSALPGALENYIKYMQTEKTTPSYFFIFHENQFF